jgi:hypothetical protein
MIIQNIMINYAKMPWGSIHQYFNYILNLSDFHKNAFHEDNLMQQQQNNLIEILCRLCSF